MDRSTSEGRPTHERSHAQIASLDVRRADSIGIRIPVYGCRNRTDALWGRVPAWITVDMVVNFDELREINIHAEALSHGFSVEMESVSRKLDAVSKALKVAGWKIISSEIRYLAKNFAQVSESSRKEVTDFLNALDDHDDVHRVYAALK